MENEYDETLDLEDTEAEKTENQDESTDEDTESDDESPAELKKRINTLEKQKEHWRKKAELKQSAKDEKPQSDTPKNDLSQKDIITLAKADIHEDDLEEVIEYARFKRISVAEALKSDVVQATLERKSEYRKSAQAANTNKARTGAKAPDGQDLQRKLQKGEVPERGSREAEELFWARRGGRRS